MTRAQKSLDDGTGGLDRWHLLCVNDVMTEQIVAVPVSATAREIERVLTENEISGVAVRDHNERIVGIVSWRDVMDFFAHSPESEPHRPHDFFRYIDGDTLEFDEYEVALDDDATAADFMNTDLLCVAATAGLREAAKMMTTHRVHRLLATDNEGHIVGILSTMDVLDTLTA
ncbi:MAG: CBS domain-containing protein [Planctomycetes bacterium]|nr:CBS domain-containing protein [Planctomycetota bacterium]